MSMLEALDLTGSLRDVGELTGVSVVTPLTEVASVLDLGRATLYRHLQATPSTE